MTRKENSKAAIGYDYCSRLFEIERIQEALPEEERHQQRQLSSKPIVDEYYFWVGNLFQPSGKLKQAATYENSLLWDTDNVIITPHNSFVEEHNLNKLREEVIRVCSEIQKSSKC